MFFLTAKVFGYIRVSSKYQNLNRQIDSLKQYVTNERDIYSDKLSGKDFNRPAYQTLKAMLRPGDTLYIHEMERLGRNKREVMEELRYFKEHNVMVRILNLPTTLLDLSQYDSKLQKMLMEMVNNILIEVLAAMAEAERDNIRKQQKEGIEAAHKRKIKFGRPKIELLESWSEDLKLWKAGKVTAVFLMKKYGISSSTFYKKVNESEL